MTISDDEVTSFLVSTERLSNSRKSPDTFDRSASDLLFEKTYLNILCWIPDFRRESPHVIENQVGWRWHILTLQKSSRESRSPVPYDTFSWILSKLTFWAVLDVKSIQMSAGSIVSEYHHDKNPQRFLWYESSHETRARVRALCKSKCMTRGHIGWMSRDHLQNINTEISRKRTKFDRRRRNKHSYWISCIVKMRHVRNIVRLVNDRARKSHV